eukprot:m.849336 g.849336  ORF g.849336 m.849336 type:complete len:239 (-) comp59573_c0_seq2:250-966(-)
MEEYTEQTGLSALLTGVGAAYTPHDAVHQCLHAAVPALSAQDTTALFTYIVPAPSHDGTCGRKKVYAAEPFDLRVHLGLSTESFEGLTDHPQAARLHRLRALMQQLARLTGAEWIGVYRRVQNPAGQDVLLKEAYFGAYSRAEFPLTEEFARGSNNSKVGLTGRAVLISDVGTHEGAYYECDASVQSELCLPIFNASGRVTGIIDAEAFRPGHFTSQVAGMLAEVCIDLPQHDSLYNA